jgi:hypothetical protein
MENTVNVEIEKKTRNALSVLKHELGHKTYSQTIDYLLYELENNKTNDSFDQELEDKDVYR